ncbi:MAG: hypothetical protein ABI854_02570 [Betaproteobacteria bacterium]
MSPIFSRNLFSPATTAGDEAAVTPLRAQRAVASIAVIQVTGPSDGSTGFSKALAVFKGAVIASSVTFVVIVLSLQAAARFA